MAVGGGHISILNEVYQTAELRVCCSSCTTKEEQITYSIKTFPHKCQGNLLLAKLKNEGKCWRPISSRPKYPHPKQYDVCWFFVEGIGCTEHGRKCTFARSSEEAFIWTFLKNQHIDHETFVSLIRESQQNVPNVEGLSEKILQDWSGEFQELCKECFHRTPCRITERESSHDCFMVLGHHWRPIMVHCVAQSQGNRVFSEIRPLPPKAFLQLCCHYTKDKSMGHNPLECQFAHSEVELAVWKQEVGTGWNRRELLWLSQRRKWLQHSDEVQPLSQNTTTELNTSSDSLGIGVQGHVENETTYQGCLLKEYRDSDKTVVIMAEHVDDVDITHDEDLCVDCLQVGTEIKWSFQIKTERLLSHVALLKSEPGGTFSLGQSTHGEARAYSVGKTFVKSGLCYEVTVTFISSLPGLYQQWLVFDFDMRPVLLQKLKVRVGGQSLAKPEWVPETIAPILERWHKGNRDIVPYKSKTQGDLLKRYGLPEMKLVAGKTADSINSINSQNYREKMHSFLYKEELVEADVISRLDFRGTITLSDLYVYTGELLGTLPFSYSITQGRPEAVLLKREVESVLVGEFSTNKHSQKVYEAPILRDIANDKEIHLQLSRMCCLDLGLEKDQTREIEVQFQLNRLWFCEMHKAIDLLPDLDYVLPDFTNCCVPSHSKKYPNLNANQQAAMEFILGKPDGKSVAPLLIYGPFGTGKTFTLASAAKEVVCQSGGRVLICTHTNSSADIYVSRHFHQHFKAGCCEVKPLRIKANKGGNSVKATDSITRMYCLLSSDGQSFTFPTRSNLDSHRIVIITTSWAKNLHNLNLSKDYFSHIMIDEASQMLECEALMALGLAGRETRIVLAGDHMQMGPKLFSVEDDKRSDHTLLNRLFYYYQSIRKNVALESRIIFNENYRSNKEIVDFVSTCFYTGKSKTIRACGNVPAHPKHYPLRFHHVRGECHSHPTSQSWYNFEETVSVVKIVRELLHEWPTNEWGARKAEDICVVSGGHQVQVIKEELWREGLGRVSVQNMANVQGKQFRVIVMTTVQTRDQLLMLDTSCLEFFNDNRVLNTAMTRAQSQVIVVGDAAALCFFGKCSKTWKCYIEHCMKKGSAQPDHLTEEFIRKDMEEISRFQRLEQNVDTEDKPLVAEDEMDQILQQMINEYAAINGDESDAEIETESNCQSLQSTRRRRQEQPVLQTLSIGRTLQIERSINQESEKGREIVSKSFVCILEDDFQHRGQNKEKGFIRKAMVPMKKGVAKICVLLQKQRSNSLPIWKLDNGDWRITRYEHINEQLRQKHVFIVQVICWKDHCLFPLGNVIDVFPIGTTVNEGLKVLNAAFNLDEFPPVDFTDAQVDNGSENRKNLRGLKTFTIDPYEAQCLDDAITVKNLKQYYEVGVHIADVASFLTKDEAVDRGAKQRGATYYCTGKKPIFMFPESVMDQWSLLPKQDRRVISLICKVNKKTHSIIKKEWQLSWIKSNRKYCYDEVEDILRIKHDQQQSENDLSFDTLDDCIAVAYRFSQAQRKNRLQGDWAYSQPRKHQTPGRRRAHLMVEELSIMFNHEMSRYLIGKDETKLCAPLRCQKSPKKEVLRKLGERHMDLIPMSAHLTHHFDCDTTKQDLEDKSFKVLSSVWSDIERAAQEKQYDIMADLIGTDDLYPQLLPVLSKLRDVQSKAYLIRSNSCNEANVGHYSLAVDFYTKASSPMRRYMDVVLQRLFHSVYSGNHVQYSPQDIDKLCEQFEANNQVLKEYEKKAETIHLSISLMKQSASKLACVVSVKQEEDNFTVSFPFNKGALPEKMSLLYRDLLLEDQPVFNEEQQQVQLKWKRRVYTFNAPRGDMYTQLQEGNTYIQVPQKTWSDIVVAVQSESWSKATTLIGTCREQVGEWRNEELRERTKDFGDNEQQPKEYSLCLKGGDVLQVQLTAERQGGFWVPRAQLLYVKPNFVVCVEHAHRPAECFAKQAEFYTKDYFEDIEEYVRIWTPLCQMGSASTAVGDSDSIIIEDVQIAWKQSREKLTEGSFTLPITCIKNWNIECNLAQCYLCIKKQIPQQPEDMGEPCTFTWVAHGVVTSCTETGKKSKNQSKTVKFYINHRSMTQVPNDVHSMELFSVEVIPKLPSDIRTENAINNTMRANDLVQRIALGRRIKSDTSAPVPKWHIIKHERPHGLPKLNESQYKAVADAVNNSFTLIQGPPGTGKTIVGAYIVYWLCKNLVGDPENKDKKEVVLYCGPSNKSVDVVAEYLLKFKDSLKPLRVYSRQTEMQEFSYPGSNLQLSKKSRQDKSSPQLRSITLHHRIRDAENPYSQDIKTFDEKNWNEISQPLTEDQEKEMESYKERLNMAREHELKRHDVILCTCTAASSANLTKAIRAKMILIDECAMATEPQALVPLASYNPQKIVLLGDHKQLRPIVKNIRAKKMGMSRSLFERCMSSGAYGKEACTLDIQYRMHEDICEFPSNEYYGGKLKTVAKCRDTVLQIKRLGITRPTRTVFVDVRGKEISQFVSTTKGNEKSVANHAESIKAAEMAKALVSDGGVNEEEIAILSPYNAQVSDIRERLSKKKLSQITVNTITKSQGSEWRYVILSVVRSCPSEDIEAEPTREWTSKHIGFVGDANQINVAITRAQDGLCILGNQELLDCSKAWKKLLQFYSKKNCVVATDEISVRKVKK